MLRHDPLKVLLTALALGLIACGGDETIPGDPGGFGGGGAGGAGGGVDVPFRLFAVDERGEEMAQGRYGDAFSVRVEGAEPGADVTVHSSMWGYAGWATFAADAEGEVDTAEDAPLAGSYEGVSAEGLVWSMELLSQEQGYSFDVALVAESDGEETVSATLPRASLSDGLVAESVSDPVVGVVYKPADATEPLPALVILGGSEGGTPELRAAYLAGYGYLTLGLAYFGEPGLPAGLTDIPMEYFADAIAYLEARPDVDDNRIGVLGGSRGGELALMLGARFAQLKVVVAEIPSHVRWGSASVQDASAWSEGGVPLSYLTNTSGTLPTPETLPDGTIGYRLTPVFEVALDEADPATLDDVTIRVEQIQGPVLMFAGDDDGIWPSCRMAQAAMDRLSSSGHSDQYADGVHCFADSGHHVPTPGWSTTDSYAGGIGSTKYIYGGTPKGVAHAQRDGLEVLKDFLAEQLASL